MMTVELSRSLNRIKSKIVTRFAPAPTGKLHSGHVLSAMFVWGIGRLAGADILLRLEDHDKERCRKDYETGILEDLHWLGFKPSGNESGGTGGFEYQRQSDREYFYRGEISRLGQKYKMYLCSCSRSDIHKRNPGSTDEIPYDGFCANKNLTGDGLSLRIEFPPESIEFYDAIHGLQIHIPRNQCGDLMLRDRKNNWTYQFCAAADDTEQGVNFIIRGEDLFTSTARQILLARMLGRDDDAVFLHHSLICGPDGQKLGKRFGSSGISELRNQGVEPGDVLGAIAHDAKLISEKKYIYTDKLASVFEPFVR